ncbi:hypothetical protein ES703_103898 [subsurface metagenome]
MGHLMKRLRTRVVVNTVRAMSFLLRRVITRIVSLIYQNTGSDEIIWWVIPDNYFKGLSEIQFYGMQFKVPAPAEDYLAYRYGENWRIPKKNHETLRDDGAVRRMDG